MATAASRFEKMDAEALNRNEGRQSEAKIEIIGKLRCRSEEIAERKKEIGFDGRENPSEAVKKSSHGRR